MTAADVERAYRRWLRWYSKEFQREHKAEICGDTSTPALSVEHLSKRFGERLAFDDVSFAVGHGEVFGFLGPSCYSATGSAGGSSRRPSTANGW